MGGSADYVLHASDEQPVTIRAAETNEAAGAEPTNPRYEPGGGGIESANSLAWLASRSTAQMLRVRDVGARAHPAAASGSRRHLVGARHQPKPTSIKQPSLLSLRSTLCFYGTFAKNANDQRFNRSL